MGGRELGLMLGDPQMSGGGSRTHPSGPSSLQTGLLGVLEVGNEAEAGHGGVGLRSSCTDLPGVPLFQPHCSCTSFFPGLSGFRFLWAPPSPVCIQWLSDGAGRGGHRGHRHMPVPWA